MGQYDHPQEALVQYWYKLLKFLSKLSKIIPTQKTADINLEVLISLGFFVASRGEQISKKLKKIFKIEEVKIHIFWETSLIKKINWY